MARRSSAGGRSSGFGRGRSPSPTMTRRAAPPPPPPKAVAPQPAAQVGQPAMASPGSGMMGQIASTAAGVAIGHTVGHAITGAFMGGNNHAEPASAEQPQATQPMQQQQPISNGQDPCRFELDQFLSCAQSQASDLSLCDGFNQVLRECKMRYGNMHQ